MVGLSSLLLMLLGFDLYLYLGMDLSGQDLGLS